MAAIFAHSLQRRVQRCRDVQFEQVANQRQDGGVRVEPEGVAERRLGPLRRRGRKEAREELAATVIPVWAAQTERAIADQGPFLGGKDISVADLKLYMIVRWLTGGKLDHIPTTVLDHCPKLRRLHDSVRDHAGVRAWQAKAS